ncbi:hypothetical protein GPNADHDJ_01139 [Stenotrophomonas maltophilia]|nr:hypothetical protein GPNADHDJ_01139 [Stenotrophomonas maltophilia]
MRPAPLRPAAAAVAAPVQPQRYLTNDEAAEYLRLSPRTLEKQRVIGGGPKFRKFGRRVMYAVSDLDAWADQRSYEATSDPEYAERHAGDYRDGRGSSARRWPSSCPAHRCRPGSDRSSGNSSICSARCRATAWRRATART